MSAGLTAQMITCAKECVEMGSQFYIKAEADAAIAELKVEVFGWIYECGFREGGKREAEAELAALKARRQNCPMCNPPVPTPWPADRDVS